MPSGKIHLIRAVVLKLRKLMNKSELVLNKNTIYHLGLAPHQINPTLIFVGDPARAYGIAAHFQSGIGDRLLG